MKRLLLLMMMCLLLTGAAAEIECGPEDSFLNSDGTANYIVRIADKAGQGIEGIAVQICSDRLCRVILTDAEGTAAMTANPYIYEVHVLRAEGYRKPDRTFLLPENGGELLLELEAE